jgi:tRNA (adenine37-N6)-methyltransferase
MPIQPSGAGLITGRAVLHRKFVRGLKDLKGFSHIFLIYQFHMAARTELKVVPFMDEKERGVFSTRSPLRPSRIGISVVELVAVRGNVVRFRGCDILDKTPLLDIKPYIPKFDCVRGGSSGWMKSSVKAIKRKRSDERFV